jgi:succinate dehydrogenase/fumarate reductase flavoprotein subunit
MKERYLEADLIIVGGGSAGCLAAIRALELKPDLKVVLFEKGDIKYSGSIARGMDALNIVAIPNFTTPELYVEAVSMGCAGILDAPASYVMAERSFALLKKLEGWGVYFPVDKAGQYRTLQYHAKGRFLTAMEEPNLKTMIARMALDKGAVAVNRVMGLEVLMDSGRAAGVVGLNVRSGELVVCRAKAVILAAGGTARFTLPNSGYLYGTFDYPGNTGDGYVMAYKAGASLTGMEFSRRTLLIKDANMPLLAITVTRGARVMDIFDNIIMENECHSLSRMEEAFAQGRGPLRIKLSHLKPEVIEEIEHILFTTERPVQERFFKGRGVDFRKSDIELWPTECQLCGGHGMAGVVVNEKAETTVPGLYAAGDVAAVPKQHLTGAFVFGEVAAERAVRFIASNEPGKLDQDRVKAVEARRNRLADSSGREIDVRDIEYKVRRLIGDYVVSPKNEYKLKRWGEWADRFREELEHRVLAQDGHELSKVYEVEHIVTCASLSATSALARKESRWGEAHFRTDYPARDDRQFFCHMVVAKGESPEHIRVTTKPVIGMDGKEVRS